MGALLGESLPHRLICRQPELALGLCFLDLLGSEGQQPLAKGFDFIVWNPRLGHGLARLGTEPIGFQPLLRFRQGVLERNAFLGGGVFGLLPGIFEELLELIPLEGRRLALFLRRKREIDHGRRLETHVPGVSGLLGALVSLKARRVGLDVLARQALCFQSGGTQLSRLRLVAGRRRFGDRLHLHNLAVIRRGGVFFQLLQPRRLFLVVGRPFLVGCGRHADKRKLLGQVPQNPLIGFGFLLLLKSVRIQLRDLVLDHFLPQIRFEILVRRQVRLVWVQ